PRGGPAFHLHAERANHLDFLDHFFGAHLVSSDAIGIEAAWLWISVEDHGLISAFAKFHSTRKTGRPGADQCDAISHCAASLEKLCSAGNDRVHGITLQLANLYRLFALHVKHARALT